MAAESQEPGRIRSVAAVAVTYRPERDALRRLVDSVRAQVDGLVVVDNADGASVQEWTRDLLDPTRDAVVALGRNRGLAAGHNAGLAWARERGHTHVLLLDQDSAATQGMVSSLMSELTGGASQSLAAVGPVFHDSREDQVAPFIRVGFPVSRKLWCEPGGPAGIDCDFLISSGALIPLEVLDRVGAMDEALFIDNVDMDWSFRARAAGYRLRGVCSARLEHRLGDDRHDILGGRHQVVTHSPVRLYYIMRNRVLLYRRRHTPRVWIAQDVLRVPVKFFFFSVLIGPRLRNTRFMLRGLADGLRGRGGPCPIGAGND